MIVVNLKDGTTLKFDLLNGLDSKAWDRFTSGEGWSDLITALSVCHKGTNHTLPIPRLRKYRCHGFGAEVAKDKNSGVPVAEKVFFRIGGILVSYVVYLKNNVTKVELKDVEGKVQK